MAYQTIAHSPKEYIIYSVPLSMTKYITISLPESMLEYIEELRSNPLVKKKYYFTSKSEFVRAGIAMLIDKIQKDIRDNEQYRKKTVPTKSDLEPKDHPKEP